MGGYVDPAETPEAAAIREAAEMLDQLLQRIVIIERWQGQLQHDINIGAASNATKAASTASPAQKPDTEPSSPTPTSCQTACATATASSSAPTNDEGAATKRRSPQKPKKKGCALLAHLEAKTTSPHKLTKDVLTDRPKAANQYALQEDYVRLKILEEILTQFLNEPGQEDFKKAWLAFFGGGNGPSAKD